MIRTGSEPIQKFQNSTPTVTGTGTGREECEGDGVHVIERVDHIQPELQRLLDKEDHQAHLVRPSTAGLESTAFAGS